MESLDDFLWGHVPCHRDLVYLCLEVIALHICIRICAQTGSMVNKLTAQEPRVNVFLWYRKNRVDNRLTVNSFNCLLYGLDAPFTVHSNLQLHDLWPYELSGLPTYI